MKGNKIVLGLNRKQFANKHKFFKTAGLEQQYPCKL